jgi:hypothetical protein
MAINDIDDLENLINHAEIKWLKVERLLSQDLYNYMYHVVIETRDGIIVSGNGLSLLGALLEAFEIIDDLANKSVVEGERWR